MLAPLHSAVLIYVRTMTMIVTTRACCQDGGVSAELSLPGGLVSGPRGADGVFSCPSGRGGARPQPEQGAALHLPPARAVLQPHHLQLWQVEATRPT